jgi:hypothetical protein
LRRSAGAGLLRIEGAMSNPEAKNCPGCDGAGTVRAMTYGHGPDDYEYDAECTACGGTGSADLADAINALPYRQHTVKPHTAMVSRAAVLEIIKARAALAAQQAPEPRAPTIAAWAMQIPGCDGSADWVELGPDKPAPVDGVVARALVWADEVGQSAQQAPAAQPVADAGPLSGKWEDAEEWMPLAWELCAEECGEEACTELVWEGGPIPEPWGDRWLKYEGEAKRLIALVRKCTAGAAPGAQQAEPQPVSDSSFEGWFSTYSPAGKGDEQRARDAYAAGLSDAAAHPQQPAPQPLTVTRIDPGFRWDGKSQHHVPNLLIEFEPVPANGPSDAKGWRDRDALAATLDGIGTATTVPTTDKEQQQ